MKNRSIKKVIGAQKVNMGGILLDQAIPLHGVDMIDPFLLIHHWDNELKPGKRQHETGVGPHPHRGFTPVTFIFKGGIYHQDSMGNKQVVYEGGTQWMHSGKGIIHSERFPKKLVEEGGDLEFIQFWVNVPANRKMVEPSYQPLDVADTPMIPSADNKVRSYLVAGVLDNKKGPIKTETDLFLMRFEMQKGGKIEVPVPKDYNALVYQLDGKLSINSGAKQTRAKDMVWYNNDGDGITLEALEDTRAILLSGRPINEPVATYGPFVMNHEGEIKQAIMDYQAGKMGILNETFN